MTCTWATPRRTPSADALARYHFQRGENVLHPIGWDAFGLPAENAAIRNNSHPADWTYANIETQAASFRRYATSFDWSRRLQTCDPAYYRWNQWLFLRLLRAWPGLPASDGYVNWCPVDQTVLANEQVISGQVRALRRRRGPADAEPVVFQDHRVRRPAAGGRRRRWRASWPDPCPADAAQLDRPQSRAPRSASPIEGRDEPVTVFTTRPDTLYGATFFVVAADSPLAERDLRPGSPRRAARLPGPRCSKLTDIERQSTDREKTGVFLGRHAVNPVNGERIPVWAADYVLPDYGTGAIMAVPAHDQRDLDFARAYGLDGPGGGGHRAAGSGRRPGSPPRATARWSTPVRSTAWARPRRSPAITAHPGRAASRARRRSTTGCGTGWSPGSASGARRSRSSTAPSCGEVPVPGRPAPGRPARPARAGPGAAGRVPAGRGRRLGERAPARTAAGRPSGTRTRWTPSWTPPGTVPAYCSPSYTEGAFDPSRVRRWAPVDLYVGGVEHAILHLLYSRFFTKMLYDMGMVDFTEPFTRLINQGQVINQRQGDVQVAGQRRRPGRADLAAHGVDAIRLTMIFASPPEDDIDWADMHPEAMVKFLGRVWRIAADVAEADQGTAEQAAATGDTELRRVTHRTIDEVTRQVEAYHG